MVNYEGIDEAVLLHALYHASQPLGLGMLQHRGDLSVDDVRAELGSAYKRPAFGIPAMDRPNEEEDGAIRFDYYHGHPFKFTLDTKTKSFEERLYDRDAGAGTAQRVIDRLHAEAK